MYAPLKVTTDYTLLKSLIKIPDLIVFLVSNNIICIYFKKIHEK